MRYISKLSPKSFGHGRDRGDQDWEAEANRVLAVAIDANDG
jgi:hypothetical protein